LGLLALPLIEIYGHQQAMRHVVMQRAQGQAQAVAAWLGMRASQAQEELMRLAHTPPDDSNDTLFSAGLVWYGEGSPPVQTYAWQVEPQVQMLVNQVQEEQHARSLTLWDASRQEWLLVLAGPSDDEAVVVGALPLQALVLPELSSIVSLNPAAYLYVADADGQPLAVLAAGQQDGSTTDEPIVTATAAVADVGWQVILREPWSDLLSPFLRLENILWIVAAVSLAVSGLSAFFGLRHIVRPLRRLDAAASQAGWGHFESLQQPVEGVAEIEELRLALVRMTERVSQYQRDQQRYIDAITLGQEEERKRLARELHDETVQSLIALHQQVELAEREVGRDPGQAAARLQALRPLLLEIITGLRRQIHALRPLYLEDLGFVPALEMLVHQVAQAHGLIGDLDVTGEPGPRLPPALEISAFRIVQEALQNVVMHASAHWVHVELSYQLDGIRLRIEDDGVGFEPPGHPVHLARDGHFGLLGMYERTQMHGGRLQIESERGKGTTVIVWLPHQAEGAAAAVPCALDETCVETAEKPEQVEP
jgi:signal transduction histidine kinase